MNIFTKEVFIMKKILLLVTVLSSLMTTIAMGANSTCPPYTYIKQASYHYYMQGGDNSWRFDSFPRGAYVFVNKGSTQEAAAKAVRSVLENLHPSTIKMDGPYCIYEGELSPAEFWAVSYPTVLYDTRRSTKH